LSFAGPRLHSAHVEMGGLAEWRKHDTGVFAAELNAIKRNLEGVILAGSHEFG